MCEVVCVTTYEIRAAASELFNIHAKKEEAMLRLFAEEVASSLS